MPSRTVHPADHSGVEEKSRCLGEADKDHDTPRLTPVVEPPHQRRPEQERQAVARIEDAVAGAPLVKGRDVCDGRSHDGLMGAHDDAEDHHAGHDRNCGVPDGQKRQQQREEGNRYQDEEPARFDPRLFLQPIVPSADGQGRQSVHGHGPRVEQCDVAVGHEAIRLQVVADDAEVDEAQRAEEGEGRIDPEDGPEALRTKGPATDGGGEVVVRDLAVGVRHEDHEQDEGDEEQPVSQLILGDPVLLRTGEDQCEDQGSEQGANLVQRLLKAEGDSRADLIFRHCGQDRVLGRIPQGLPDSLHEDQHHEGVPVHRPSHEGHGEEHAVSRKDEEPVPTAPVRRNTRQQAQEVPGELPDAEHDAHLGRADAQQVEVLTVGPPGALVDHIAQQADHTEQHDHPHSRREPFPAHIRPSPFASDVHRSPPTSPPRLRNAWTPVFALPPLFKLTGRLPAAAGFATERLLLHCKQGIPLHLCAVNGRGRARAQKKRAGWSPWRMACDCHSMRSPRRSRSERRSSERTTPRDTRRAPSGPGREPARLAGS